MKSLFLQFCSIPRQCAEHCFVYTWNRAKCECVRMLHFCRDCESRRYAHNLYKLMACRVTEEPTNLLVTLQLAHIFELVYKWHRVCIQGIETNRKG